MIRTPASRRSPRVALLAALLSACGPGGTARDAQARVLALYRGRVRDEPHHYEGPEGRYLIVELPGDTRHRIVFETDGRRVTSYRAGRRPAVDYVEGCA